MCIMFLQLNLDRQTDRQSGPRYSCYIYEAHYEKIRIPVIPVLPGSTINLWLSSSSLSMFL